MTTAVIVDTSVANIASLLVALKRVELNVEVSCDPDRIERAEALILPGVGSFDAAMARLRALQLVEPLRAYIDSGRRFLAVCLGMQMLCARSDESYEPSRTGLGVIASRVRKLPNDVIVPHMGWNRVTPDSPCSQPRSGPVDEAPNMVTEGDAYFANSYGIMHPPDGWSCAWTTHGVPFVSAIQRGRQLACQFHPELSGSWGLDLLRRWCFAGKEQPTC